MKKIQRILFLTTFLLLSIAAQAQKAKPGIFRADPPFWWKGMEDNNLQVLVMGENVAAAKVNTDLSGLIIKDIHKFESPDFVAIDFVLGPELKAGMANIFFEKDGKREYLPFEIRNRKANSKARKGLDQSDVIYLLMPDRFANGDPRNDEVKGMNQVGINRDSMFLRHGGDLEGIRQHLDYFSELGVSTLWLNPVLENNQPKESYHGYAVTDHYRIDPRFGDNEQYRRLVEEMHGKGLKMVVDFVYNHWGDQHYLHRRLPSKDWIHQQEKFQRTSYRAPTLSDPYASKSDRDIFTDGWFDHHMPDLNQQNPFVAKYLIQNSIWWLEYADLDGIRIDTYLYSDQQFMRDLVARVLKEYPSLTIFGETWVHGVGLQAYITQNNFVQSKPGNLPGVTDFQLYYSINDALTQKMGWTEGISRMYFTLAQDYFYKNPNQNVIFLDNHDLSRFYSVVGQDFRKYKMGLAWLLTMRGIPQLYYGTEILMANFANPDGKVRSDFPGGWIGDKSNKFKAEGRTEQENEAFEYLKNLLHWRKVSGLLVEGKLMQFVPQDGIYVYFRYTDNACLMVAMNCNDEAKSMDLSRFAERLKGYSKFWEVQTKLESPIGTSLQMSPWTSLVFELRK